MTQRVDYLTVVIGTFPNWVKIFLVQFFACIAGCLAISVPWEVEQQAIFKWGDVEAIWYGDSACRKFVVFNYSSHRNIKVPNAVSVNL